MKISILSMQDVDNFGSLLQAYGLKKILIHNDVDFIKIEKRDEDNQLLNDIRVDYSYESEKNNNSIISKLSKIDIHSFNRIKIKKANKHQNSIFNKFRKEILKINYNNKNKYDLCIIGSDEVFNCLIKSEWGFTSQLFGNINNADKIITYAASCGSTTFEQVPPKVKEKISKSLNKMEIISVRDNNTYEFVKKLSTKPIEINLDPVLVSDFEKEMNEHTLNLPYDYCIVYSYYNRINKKDEIKAIKELCKRKKLKIISVGAPQFWIKNHITCSPFEMLNLFSKAKFVITDTFHGTIFAAKYSKKFAVIIRDSNKNKLDDLVDRIDIKKHCVNELSDLFSIYNYTKDYEKINSILLNERNKTLNYLNSFAIINKKNSEILSKEGD